MFGRGTIAFAERADGIVAEIATREQIEPQRVALYVRTQGRSEWRYVVLDATVSTRPASRVTRYLDLSEESAERRFAEQSLERNAARWSWTQGDANAESPLGEHVADRLRAALDGTRGVTRDSWQQELEAAVAEPNHWWSLGSPVSQVAPRSAAPPRVPIPYFAPRSGALPPPGTPAVGGIELPAGDLCGGAVATSWATFDAIPEPSGLVAALADAFTATGLWPLCWAWEQDEVDVLFSGPGGDPGALDPAQIAASRWESIDYPAGAIAPFGKSFPGLAEPSSARSDDDAPFRVVDETMGHQDAPGRQILLVPCNRPGDAPAAIGWGGQRITSEEVRALLRSWEERFAAVPIALDPWAVTLAVGAPPTTMEQALHLAAEMAAVAAIDTIYYDDDLKKLAAKILSTPGEPKAPLRSDFTSTHWSLDFDSA